MDACKRPLSTHIKLHKSCWGAQPPGPCTPLHLQARVGSTTPYPVDRMEAVVSLAPPPLPSRQGGCGPQPSPPIPSLLLQAPSGS